MTSSRRRAALAAFAAALVLAPVARPADGAVVLVYHHVADDTPASTSVTPAQFERHLDYLADNAFTVVPLERIVDALRAGEPLPERAVAITFDDAYPSIHSEAMPRLAKRGWPFTVFVATDPVDSGLAGYLRWDALRELRANGAALQNHSASHAHLLQRGAGESDAAWAARVRRDIRKAQARLADETGARATLFAYPYGEFSADLAALVGDLGLTGVGQYSGAAFPAALDSALPRFPVNRAYASLETLGVKLSSLPLRIERLSPRDGVLDPGDARPVVTLRLADPALRPGALTCFLGGQPDVTVEWAGRTATLRARRPLPVGRSSYTCTMPSSQHPGRYHWLSFPWFRPRADGSWPDD